MILKRMLRSIRGMPRGAYILLRFTLALSCLMLLASFALFLLFEQQRPLGRSLYMTAVALLENPAGVLIVGGICVAILIDKA